MKRSPLPSQPHNRASFIIMPTQHVSPRAEYLQEERERVQRSASLAEKFPRLRSLSVTLTYFAPGGLARRSEIKYTCNLAYAKALFCFACPNDECVGGNFDLSEALARAVAEHRELASGEVCCQGWKSKTAIDRIYCGHVLRYQLRLGY
jgi:hypothetical protein